MARVDGGGVSIHAPHAGRDRCSLPCTRIDWSFNPRAPYGARLHGRCTRQLDGCFNPRAPCGARPRRGIIITERRCFNPRAPCGARRCHAQGHAPDLCFNPRAPCGARPGTFKAVLETSAFQSTRPMRGATQCYYRCNYHVCVSIHAPHAGRDLLR